MIFAVPRREYRRTDPTHVRSIMSDYGPNRRFWRRFRGFMGAISTFLNHSSILKNTIPFVHRSLYGVQGVGLPAGPISLDLQVVRRSCREISDCSAGCRDGQLEILSCSPPAKPPIS